MELNRITYQISQRDGERCGLTRYSKSPRRSVIAGGRVIPIGRLSDRLDELTFQATKRRIDLFVIRAVDNLP